VIEGWGGGIDYWPSDIDQLKRRKSLEHRLRIRIRGLVIGVGGRIPRQESIPES